MIQSNYFIITPSTNEEIIKVKYQCFIIEIKSTENIKLINDFSALKSYKHEFPGSEFLVISNDKKNTIDKDGFHFMYWEKALKYIFG